MEVTHMIPALIALSDAIASAPPTKPFGHTLEASGLAFRHRHWWLYRVTARVCPSPARRAR